MVRTQANNQGVMVPEPKKARRNPHQLFHLKTLGIQAQESERLSAQSTTKER